MSAFIILTMHLTAISQQQVAAEDKAIDAKIQAMIIDSLAKTIDSIYVFPDVAKKMVRHLREKLKEGAYKDITSLTQFTHVLTTDLRDISQDKHLAVRYANRLPAELTDSLSQDDRELAIQEQRRENFGFYKLERIDGNIGYIDLRQFANAQWAGGTAIAAMNFLENCDALIFDLRQNGGGESSMIQLLASYLFDEPKKINNFYIRTTDSIEQSWTQAYVPGKKLLDIPVYILTSNYTFSAAEEFTYDLKNMKRATIVGETTGGGAHPVVGVFFPSLNVGAQIPYGRAVNPITGTNWEGVGIAPDIAVPQEQALQAARLDALRKILDRTTDEDRKHQLTWSMGSLEALLNPAAVDSQLLKKYAGVYGPRAITFENGQLYYQREGRPKYKMIPMSEDTFVFEDLGYFRLKFIKDSTGRVTEVMGLYDNGQTDNSPRTLN